MDMSRSRRVGRPVLAGFPRIGGTVAILVGLCCGPWLGSRATAQAPARSSSKFIPNDSGDAEAILRNAGNQARDRQWREAIDLYQRVIERYGEKMARLPKGEPGADPADEFVLYMDGRRYCHRRIAQMPPEAREIYRHRIDPMAERWYRDGAARRDAGPLRRVVDQAFCSSWGDDALELLGDLAFQDGRFGEALSAYSQLVADRSDDPFVLVHPDPSVDLARLAAKKYLCRAAGEQPPNRDDLAEFARRYPGATGRLAGRTGGYASILAEAIAGDRLETPGQPDGRWPTFAGSPRRTRVVPGPIDVGQVQWRIDLEKVSTAKMNAGGVRGPTAVPSRPESLLAFHPIVLGDQVLVCDGSKVLAYNLSDRPAGAAEGGEARPVTPAWRHDPDGSSPPQAARPHSSIPRFTLTAQGHRIYARMGMSSTLYNTGGRRNGYIAEPGTSSIVALDWDTQGKLLWEIRSTTLELPHRQAGGRMQTVNFEGTPVADARNVYVAVTDHSQQTMVYVACFDAETGTKRWIRYLGTAPSEPDQFQGAFNMPMFGAPAPGDYRHRLLTLEGATLYYQTNLGALIALDAETGSTQWIATYPRQEPNRFGQGSERDLNPAVVDEGRVLIAPSDSDAILAFDSGSGRLLWKTEAIADDVKLSHVLGVAKGRLIVTGDRVLLFDVRSGKLAGVWPDSANKSLEGYGRGLLAGDLIYWPTKSEIQVLDQRTGLKAGPPIKLHETYHETGGNLAAGDGYLIVAKSDGLVVFCQNSRLIDRYRQEIARAPERAANYYRMARAAEAVGRDETALDSYRQAIQKARPDETIDGISLAGAARDHLFRMLMRQAARLRRERSWEPAVAQLESASRFARFDGDRLEARLLLADIHLDASHPRDAVDVLEGILLDGRLRPLPVAADDGRRTIRADLMVADRLTAIVRRFGREPYERYDREAAALLARGKAERDPHLLAEVRLDYPVARVLPEALMELGALHESRGRLAEATQAYKRLLAASADDDWRARAIWSMARVYDARKLYVAARDAYLELAARYPRARLESGGETLAERVEAKLGREPYVRLVDDRRQPPLAPPMFRRWQWSAPADRAVRAMIAEGVVPSLDASRIVLADRDRLRMLDAADGSSRWSSELGSSAGWAGYLDDKLIAAGARQVAALDLSTGAVQWRYQPGNEAKERSRPDPFAAGDGTEEPTSRRGEALHGFRLVKGRVFCLRGSSELIALDGDTGAVDWSFAAPAGHINPRVWVGTDRILLQVDRPNQLVVLRTDDGQPVARTPLADADQLERPAMPIDEDSVLVVLDPRTVKRFELNTGQFSWEYRESEDLPVNGPPCLLGGGNAVLLLHEGRTLIRLDPATGAKRWSCPLGLEDLSRRPGALVFDDRRFYCISRFTATVTLRAISIEDGTAAWSSEWTTNVEDSSWSLALAADHVFAYPVPTVQARGVDAATIPVIVRRRDSGMLVQRLVFPASGKVAEPPPGQDRPGVAGEGPAAVTFNLDHLGAVVATPRGIWGLGVRNLDGLSAPVRGASR
jgi:outer membrane protein assembly factor BamB/tetratricopeptide (TPR) repeat protein